MKDRVASQPGRVLITPEDGSAPFYATMTMADEPTQEGDAPIKKNLLTDETAALLGLDSNATVNQFLAVLFNYCNFTELANVNITGNQTSFVIDLGKDLTRYSVVEILYVVKSNENAFKFRTFLGSTQDLLLDLIDAQIDARIGATARTSLLIKKIDSEQFVAVPQVGTSFVSNLTGEVFSVGDYDTTKINISCSGTPTFNDGSKIIVLAR